MVLQSEDIVVSQKQDIVVLQNRDRILFLHENDIVQNQYIVFFKPKFGVSSWCHGYFDLAVPPETLRHA